MITFFLKKYWIGLLVAALCIVIGCCSEDNFNDGMFLATCLGIMAYFFTLIVFAKRGRTAITMVEGTISFFKFVWYVISLKPLRRWILRTKVVGLNPEPYLFLPMYGSITDAQAMMDNYTSSFWHDHTPAVRAALWRLLARKVLKFGPAGDGNVVIKLADWVPAPSDGVDQALEKTIYRFLQQSQDPQGVIDTKKLYRVISYYKNKKKEKVAYELHNQYRFADLLSTSISKRDYSEEETRHLYGMKRFLKALPSSFEQLTGSASQLDMQRIWSEYVAFAYLFGIERKTISRLSAMIPETSQPSLLYLMSTSKKHQDLVTDLMKKASDATYYADYSVAANRGRLKMAWHAEEVYDIETNSGRAY